MRTALLLFGLITGSCLQAQEELINTFIRQSSVAGGTPYGGTSITTSYTFIAQDKIVLPNIETETGNLVLEKGDSIIVHLSSFEPYQKSELVQEHQAEVLPIYKSKFTITNYMDIKYINISHEIELTLVITYLYKKEEFIAAIKAEIDQINRAYAP